SPLSVDRSDDTPVLVIHPNDHNISNAAINDIVTELGSNPSGGFSNVQARLANIESLFNGNINGTARVAVSKNGVLAGRRRKINLVPGSNVSLTVLDDSVNEKVDVVISSDIGSHASSHLA